MLFERRYVCPGIDRERCRVFKGNISFLGTNVPEFGYHVEHAGLSCTR